MIYEGHSKSFKSHPGQLNIFVVATHAFSSYKTRKNNSDFFSLIRNAHMLPQQKCLVMLFFVGDAQNFSMTLINIVEIFNITKFSKSC